MCVCFLRSLLPRSQAVARIIQYIAHGRDVDIIRAQGCAATIPWLVKAGASTTDVNDDGFTPVECALVAQDVACSYALYCAGALFTKRQLLFLGILVRESSLLRCARRRPCARLVLVLVRNQLRELCLLCTAHSSATDDFVHTVNQ
jgi:hypothetical protein